MLRENSGRRLGVVLRLLVALTVLSWISPAWAQIGLSPNIGTQGPVFSGGTISLYETAGSAIRSGFNTYTLPGNDDGSTGAVNLGFTIDFFGYSASQVYVNNNGNITFAGPQSTFTPYDLTSTGSQIIAPFFADVDTRAGNVVTYGAGTVDGHLAFGVNYVDVGYYSRHTDKTNSFQVVLIQREDLGSGDFDIEFNYGRILWETGDASGGSGGLGGNSARAGFSNGTRNTGTYYELQGSAIDGYFLDGAETGLIYHSINSDVPGRYFFYARNGTVYTYAKYGFEYQYNDGSGDYYKGYAYARSDYGYYGDRQITKGNENSASGYYRITGVLEEGANPDLMGQVFVTSYHDGETNQNFTSADIDLFVTSGAAYLGSESGYIYTVNNQGHLFGVQSNTLYEADLLAGSYDFRFDYANGDYYVGSGFAAENYVDSHLSFQWADEYGNNGTYTVGNFTPTGNYSQLGQVFVTEYGDYESGNSYSGDRLFPGNPENYLGSEYGYIIQADVNDFYFGAGTEGQIFEADLGAKYFFTHYYDEEAPPTYSSRVIAGADFQNIYYAPQFNEEGQAVWYGGADPRTNPDALEIFFYQYPDDSFTQLTTNSVPDLFPTINDLGQVVYATWNADGSSDLFLYADGQTSLLTHEAYKIYYPLVNNEGQVVWAGGDTLTEVYLYSGGQVSLIANNLFNPDGIKNTPVINDLGQIVWAGWDGINPSSDIYLYDPTTSLTQVISTNPNEDNNPFINNLGQIVWEASEGLGQDQEIFLYDLGTSSLTQITDDNLLQTDATINNLGQIVWQELAGTSREVYLYSQETITRVTLNVYDDLLPRLNDEGYIVWFQSDGEHTRVMLAQPSRDSYAGWVYASQDYGYNVDPLLNTLDMNTVDQQGEAGYYEITSRELVEDASKYGQVFVDNYYDAASGQNYTPLGNDQPLGSNYLGSESGFILSDQNEDFRFGASETGAILEADALYTRRYDFTFKYSDGDAFLDKGDVYQGYVYAPPDFGYSVGATSHNVLDENLLLGSYSVTAEDDIYHPYDPKGQVFVTSYNDADTVQIYPPLTSALPHGDNYLGSESGYIQTDGVAEYFFGAGIDGRIYEADGNTLGVYEFRFTFGGGDYYTGTAFAELFHGYSVGQAWTTRDENGQVGAYQITGVAYGNDASLYGQVRVNSYFDAESGKTFVPVNAGGSGYLGSESGYIAGPAAPTRFGQGYEEADYTAGQVNTFRFTYANGDYYTGKVYAEGNSGLYYQGYTKTVTDENGQKGIYEITEVAAGTPKDAKKYGKVFVTDYYDAESGKHYTPLNSSKPMGSMYLGSETGYLFKKGPSYLRFGAKDGVFWEADIAALYNFSFYYSNGDYYQGTVYALMGAYSLGKVNLQDQDGMQGYYEITGVKELGATSKALGQVYVSSYYDAESGKPYQPLSKNKAAGINYLGSEFDYIVKKNVPSYYFGGGFYQANAN